MKKVGRPTKYKPIYSKKIIKFFKVERIKIINEKFYYKNGDEKEKEIEVANELPTLEDFAESIHVNRDTLLEWATAKDKSGKLKHPEFSGAYTRAKQIQEAMWFQNSLKGLYNPQFAIFAGKNVFGWKDKSEVDSKHTGTINIKRVSNLK